MIEQNIKYYRKKCCFSCIWNSLDVWKHYFQTWRF